MKIQRVFLLSTFIALSISTSVFSKPQPKGTDIFIADLKLNSSSKQIANPINITDREGYDNQPSFTPDGDALLYTSMRQDEQADIYKYNLTTNLTDKLTSTSESEYSPIVTPDQSHFSVVRVEKDSTQRLWQFSLDGKNPELVNDSIAPVGYYCWSNNTIAMFILGEHNTLQILNKDTGKLDIITADIGRSLHKIPGKNAISYLHKVNDKNWLIKELDLDTMKSKTLIKSLDKSEDFVWTPDGVILMGHGSKLFKWNPSKDKNWIEIADLKNSGIKEILRLAVSPKGNKLALISNIP